MAARANEIGRTIVVVLVNAVAFFVLGTRTKLDILATHLLKAAQKGQ